MTSGYAFEGPPQGMCPCARKSRSGRRSAGRRTRRTVHVRQSHSFGSDLAAAECQRSGRPRRHPRSMVVRRTFRQSSISFPLLARAAAVAVGIRHADELLSEPSYEASAMSFPAARVDRQRSWCPWSCHGRSRTGRGTLARRNDLDRDLHRGLDEARPPQWVTPSRPARARWPASRSGRPGAVSNSAHVERLDGPGNDRVDLVDPHSRGTAPGLEDAVDVPLAIDVLDPAAFALHEERASRVPPPCMRWRACNCGISRLLNGIDLLGEQDHWFPFSQKRSEVIYLHHYSSHLVIIIQQLQADLDCATVMQNPGDAAEGESDEQKGRHCQRTRPVQALRGQVHVSGYRQPMSLKDSSRLASGSKASGCGAGLPLPVHGEAA